MFYFILGILFTVLFFPILQSISEVIILILEKKKMKINQEMVEIGSITNKIKDEIQPIINKIGFIPSNQDEGEE